MEAAPVKGFRTTRFDRAGTLVGAALVMAFLLAGQAAFPAEKKLEKKMVNGTVYEVPTTGTIEDVTYRPEYDEWWVKCREGGNIAVYTFDRRTKKWGQVLFTVHAPQPKAAKAAKAEQAPKERSAAVPGSGAPPPKPQTTATPGQPKAQPKNEADQHPKHDKKKWWDPLNLLKTGQRLMIPPGWEKK
jgi:hypothetical protein